MAKPIVAPIAITAGKQVNLVTPWFVQNTEYDPALGTFKPLVNGEEAFGEVYRAIMAATDTVEIVCWGFQPSMCFVRGAQSEPIGNTLLRVARRGVKVRILSWDEPLPVAEWSENMAPGRNLASYFHKDNEIDDQRDFDRLWHVMRSQAHLPLRDGQPTYYIDPRYGDPRKEGFQNIDYQTRGFNPVTRAEMFYNEWRNGKARAGALAAMPTHHQKMVLVDYEHTDKAVGFVMGHNMLDAYWDKDDHSYVRMLPYMGRNGATPRQDISSVVTGPILRDLNRNFCDAWKRETREDLGSKREALAGKHQRQPALGSPVYAHIVRTQSQAKRQNIRAMYLNAVKHATSYLYIENQYFRWPLLADTIKDAVQAQIKAGRDPGTHGPIHLFVVTNSSDEGMGMGTTTTHEMLDRLGRADVMPGVDRAQRSDPVQGQLAMLTSAQQQLKDDGMDADAKNLQPAIDKQRQALNDINQKPVLPRDIPGLKVHICTLVAPDSPADHWLDVYVHAKLMLIDDVFMTLGSANINERSMSVDSELNIYHANPDISAPLRKRLWGIHTKGMGAQDDVGTAFAQWERIITTNKTAKNRKEAPIASLIGFLRESPKRSALD